MYNIFEDAADLKTIIDSINEKYDIEDYYALSYDLLKRYEEYAKIRKQVHGL